MTKRLQLRRVLALTLMVCAGFAGLGYRLVDLQVLRHDELAKLAQNNTQRKFWKTSRRGDILDARGNVLATSVPVETVWANPALLAGQHLLGNSQAVFAHALAPLLQMDEAGLFQQMQPRVRQKLTGETVTNQYVVLKRNVTEEVWRRIEMTKSNLPALVDTGNWRKSDRMALTNLCHAAVGADAEQMRVYPNGVLAAQVVGFTGVEDAANDSHVVSQISGRDGIELAFNRWLSGVAGWRRTETDRQSRELVALRDEDVHPHDGLNVELTIDSVIQNIVEQALADAYREHSPENITGIVIRPRTGEILAMASLPSFDPNNLQTINTNNEANVVINRVMEPGSTFKTVVISAALNEHVVTLNDTVFCENGVFNYGGIKLHDAEHDHFGTLTVEQVLQKSSNIGASKIGIKLGPEKLYDYMTAFGLGQATGIPLPFEQSARPWVRPAVDPSGKSNWKKYLIAQIPMGQGVMVTRLQMAMVLSAIANGGVLMRPMLVKNLQDRNGRIVEQYQPQAVRRVITPETAKQMVEALKTVVTPDGTAPKAALTNYIVAGKTGTAQKAINGRYADDRSVVTFIGFFPADNPEVCISIVMDSPKEGGHAFGGALCGPVFKDVAERCASYLNILPDRTVAMSSSALPMGVVTSRARSNLQTQ